MKHRNFFSLAIVCIVALLFLHDKRRSFLGVDVDTVKDHPGGLFVNGIYKGYGAQTAGLKRGDIITAINSEKVDDFNDLVSTLDEYEPGTQVEVSFIRDKANQKVTATISKYPDFLKYNNGTLNDDKYDNKSRTIIGLYGESMWDEYALLATSFTKESPAEKAGLKVGDVIQKMDNYEFATMEELRYYLSKYKKGDVVNLIVKRDGEQKSIKVTLDEEECTDKDIKKDKDFKYKKEEKRRVRS